MHAQVLDGEVIERCARAAAVASSRECRHSTKSLDLKSRPYRSRLGTTPNWKLWRGLCLEKYKNEMEKAVAKKQLICTEADGGIRG